MIKSKLVSLIKMRLGNRTDTDIDTRIDAELDMAQEQLERGGNFVPWFLLSETATYTTTPGESRVAVPTDMLLEYEEGALFYNGAPLTKHEYDALSVAYRNAEGPPEAYALSDEYFILFPVPDDFYQINMKYYQADTLPSVVGDASENRWMKNAAQWLLSVTGQTIARFIKDQQAVAEFTADAQTAETAIYKRHIERAETNVDRRMGDE